MFIIVDMPWSTTSRIITQLFVPVQRLVMFFLTGKSVIERILANRTLPFAFRVHQIENVLGFTSTTNLNKEIGDAQREKSQSTIHDQYNIVIHKFDLYQKLLEDIRQIRTTKVTSTEEDHLELFEKIWSRLVLQTDDDHEPMQAISKRWKKIGFQVRTSPISKRKQFIPILHLGTESINRFSWYGSSRSSIDRVSLSRSFDLFNLCKYSTTK